VFRRIRENIDGIFEEPRLNHRYQMGVDLARLQDFTVITVVDRHSHQVVHFDRFNQIDWNLQKARIEATCRRYNLANVVIDSSGVGDAVVEDLKRLGLPIKEFKFSNSSKKQLIENLAIKIEQGLVKYPNIPELINELEVFTYEMTPSGNVRYNAPEGETDDCVISACLAYWEIGDKLPLITPKKGYGFDFNVKKNQNLVFRKRGM